ncbi:ABC transporter permease [Catalinimonas niigatensis]|uniref:ABC transporter permease n=1 Tax=Catalinimonas niigatensis TaxID=1397264 RepID=UPI00266659AF|nr:ABC transporter permease [Catalinimonas niigatensis]WPP48965.1 ABC transporter permease [Catalinimonas niigatensis]
MSKLPKHQPEPPKLATRFLRWYCRAELVDEVEGDLYELFQRRVDDQGLWKAKALYWINILMFLHPDYIRKNEKHYSPNHIPMLRHYFNISTRVLLKHKFYTAINILGLAAGMGVCLLIYQYIHFELSYDQFHENDENTYRITFTGTRNGEDIGLDASTTYGLGPAADDMIPEMESFVRTHPHSISPVVTNPEQNEPYLENNLWYVDSNFLQMFSFPLKYGDENTGLSGKYDVIITEKLAEKYFGNVNPIGKELKLELGVLSGNFIVRGVLQNLPDNSHMEFDILLPLSNLLENDRSYRTEDGWSWDNFTTYVTLNENTKLKEVGEKFDRLITSHIGDKLAQSNVKIETKLQPLTDIHLRSESSSNIQRIQFFTVVVIFILLMAWVNFINLSTARAMQRAKEVGVRKSIGALKWQLIGQFITESLLINLVAALLAIGIAYIMLPILNDLINQEITFSVLQSTKFWLIFLQIIFLGALLSGLYPAFVLSSFKPVSILKSGKTTTKQGFSLRKALIAFQFLISLLLISGTYLVYKQITFMKSQDMGIDMEKILVVQGPRVMDYSNLRNLYNTFKNEASRYHSIASVTGTGAVPGTGNMFRGYVWRKDKLRETEQLVNVEQVDGEFTQTFDLQLLAGTTFTRDMRINDMQRSGNDGPVIINEKAVKAFGFDSPEDALHEKLITIVGDTVEVEIVGVVKDFYWNSLQKAQMPSLFALNDAYGAYFSFRINLSDIPETIAFINATYDSVFPGNPFDYFFLDAHFNKQYQADIQFRNLFSAFSALAIFIACIGLFALVSYSATLRIKEIGIRKVLGAGVGHLMMLLSREYLMLLLIAVGLAVPAIIIGGKAWLENYAYKVGISIDLFLIPGLMLMFISFLTVCYRTYTTAKTNPVDSLKTE